MKINTLKHLMVVVVLLLSFSACTETTLQTRLVSESHPRAQLIMGNADMDGTVRYRDLRFGQVGAFQRVVVGVENLTNERYSLEYRVNWQDNQGFAINSNNAWHRFTLAPHQIYNIQSVGKVPEAYKVQMTVRYLDDLFIESRKQQGVNAEAEADTEE